MNSQNLIFAAFMLYTTTIFFSSATKKLDASVLFFLGAALVCDATGTYLMAQKNTPHIFGAHAMFGYLAIFIMSLHCFWAWKACFGNDRMKTLFHKHSTRAWFLWMAAFSTGFLFHA